MNIVEIVRKNGKSLFVAPGNITYIEETVLHGNSGQRPFFDVHFIGGEQIGLEEDELDFLIEQTI